MFGSQLHPSPTASDGKVIDKSQYPAPEDPKDDVIECAQCGMVVDLGQSATGDSLGAIPEQTTITSKTVNLAVPKGAAPISYTIQYRDPVETGSGCPFCHSMNPQGKLRDRDPFFNTKNLENL